MNGRRWLRALVVWFVIMGAESIHGAVRTLVIAPLVGDFRARQVAVFTGSLLIVVIVASLLMLWGLHALVNRTKIGKAIRAVAEDQATASLMGINVNRMISLTFLIGGAMGGAAGVLFGVQYSLVNPYTGFIPGLKAFTAAVLGGIGNIPGAMLGGLVLGLLEAFAASYLSLLTGGAFGAEYKDIFAFSILILILIFRPKGLLGEVVRERA